MPDKTFLLLGTSDTSNHPAPHLTSHNVRRLHYNTSQRRADHLSQVGGLVGLAAAACLLQGQPSAKPLHYVGGASLGTAAGVLLHVLTRPADMKGRNKMLHELVN